MAREATPSAGREASHVEEIENKPANSIRLTDYAQGALTEEEKQKVLGIDWLVSPTLQRRYQFLRNKKRSQILSQEENQELMTLSETVEKAEKDRLEYMVDILNAYSLAVEELIEIPGMSRKPRFANAVPTSTGEATDASITS